MYDMHTEPGLSAASTPQPGHYDIDPSRSTVTFRTRHLFGLAPVRGTITIRSGTVDIEPVTGSGVHAESELPPPQQPARSQRAISALPGSRHLPGDDLLLRPH